MAQALNWRDIEQARAKDWGSREDAPNLLHQEPGVVLDGLFTPVPIVVEKLRLLLDVVLGHQYKARCVPQHHHLQEGYSVPRFHYAYFWKHTFVTQFGFFRLWFRSLPYLPLSPVASILIIFERQGRIQVDFKFRFGRAWNLQLQLKISSFLDTYQYSVPLCLNQYM